MQKRNFWLSLLAALAVGALVVVGLFWYLSTKKDTAAAPAQSTQSEQATPSQSKDEDEPTTPPTTAPTYDELKNAELEVPESCAKFAMGSAYSGSRLQFENAVAGGEDEYSQVAIADVAALEAAGSPYAAVNLLCKGPDPEMKWMWAVYGSDLSLLGSGEAAERTVVGGSAEEAVVQDFTSSGAEFTYTVYNLILSGGRAEDAALDAPNPVETGSATLTWSWDGSSAKLEDLVYELPSGTARQPDQAAVQEVYDLIAAGDPAALDHVGPKVASMIENGIGAQATEAAFMGLVPVGGTVNQCILGGVSSTSEGTEQGYQDSKGIFFGWIQYDPPGSFYCGIDTLAVGGFSPWDVDSAGIQAYSQWLVVQSDANGNPTVELISRNFS